MLSLCNTTGIISPVLSNLMTKATGKLEEWKKKIISLSAWLYLEKERLNLSEK